LCNDLKNQNFVVKEEVRCWIDDFKKFIEDKGEEMPIKPSRFEYYLKRWPLETD